MVDHYFCGAPSSELSEDDQDASRTTLDEASTLMADQMNDYSSNYSYGSFVPSGWSCPAQHEDYDTEWEYLEGCARELAKLERRTVSTFVHDLDTWIITDAKEFGDWGGYGRMRDNIEVDLTGDGNKDSRIHVGRVIEFKASYSGDPHRITKSMFMHESAHSFTARHKHGRYQLNTDAQIMNVTPMATCYVKRNTPSTVPEEEGYDVCYWGSGTQVDGYFCQRKNEEYDEYCGTCNDWCRHILYLNEYCDDLNDEVATREIIENNTPPPGRY